MPDAEKPDAGKPNAGKHAPDHHSLAEELRLIEEAAREASAIALRWFRSDPKVWMKEGDSPVSQADLEVDTFLKKHLLAARPDYGWLSEETADDPDNRLDAHRTFVVDPIDGTRGFIAGDDRWCVSIALVEDNRPIVGVLACPARDEMWTAVAGEGAFCDGECLTARPPDGAEAVAVTGPRSVQTALRRLSDRAIDRRPFIPSLAYRIALVARGDLHLAIARASAKDWDLAAADLILTQAGGRLSDLDGAPLAYNCPDPRHGALVGASASAYADMLDLARQAVHEARAATRS